MTDMRRMIYGMSEIQQHQTAAIPDWTLGWRLKRALEFAGVQVGEMAQELGVNRGTMSRWLNDHGPVREIYLRQWAARCGVPLAWLRDGDDVGSRSTWNVRSPALTVVAA